MFEPVTPQEITQLLGDLIQSLNTQKGANTPAARRLANLLSDDFSDQNDVAGQAVREIVAEVKQALPPPLRARLQDLIDVALARVDPKASIKYWLRDDDGGPINITALNCFEIDFFRYAHDEVLIGILFAPMGSGKSTLIRGLICYEIGQNQDTMQQLICQSDKAAKERGLKIMDILESPHYQKVFPHIKKDMRQWGNEAFLVQRTGATITDVVMDSKGSAGGAGPTLAMYGVTSRALTGTRSNLTDLDDVVTIESGLQNAKEGETVDAALKTKVFTRDKAPIGQTEGAYDRSKNPTRFRIIGTPYSQDDPVFKRRDWPGSTTALIGVNDDFTAYNVEIWNLPKKYFKILKRKYGTGIVKLSKLPQDLIDYCKEQGIPVLSEYKLGPGVRKDHNKPCDFTMEIPLAMHRGYYLDKHKSAQDTRRQFDLPYKCEVYSESELLFPNFANSIFKSYPGHGEFLPDGTPNQIVVDKASVMTKPKGGLRGSQTGIVARMINAPNDYKIKIAMVDLSREGRKGTVISVAVLTPENRRRVVEIRRGGWDGEQIADQIKEVFDYHKDLQVCYIESVALQKLFIELMAAQKEKYWFWSKLDFFEDTGTGKNDPQTGIMVMGVGYAGGAFELPDVMNSFGHGRQCECGYCIGIWDGMTWPRLKPVDSDVLITYWGIHLRMPHGFEPPPTGLPPSTQQRARNGYELLQGMPRSAMATQIMQGTTARDDKSDKTKRKDGLTKGREVEALFPGIHHDEDPDWGGIGDRY